MELKNVDDDELERVWQEKYKYLSFSEMKAKKRMQVMMAGVIEPPRLLCPKSVLDAHAGKKVVPIAIKQIGGTQKFRIPFKNESAKDLDIEFSFVKIGERKDEEISMNEYLEFFCMPGTLKIASESTGILSVMVKVNNDKLEAAKQN